MSIRRSPWWFCTGWWSPWCVIDAIAHCKIPWICKRHDDAQVRWFEAHYNADDWPDDEAPQVTTTSTWPVYTGTNTSSCSAATVTWRDDGTADWRWS